MSDPEPVESTVVTPLRPADVFIAAPALARCLARSVYGPEAVAGADDGDLEPLHHLVPVSGHGRADAPVRHRLDLVRADAGRLRRLVADTDHAHRLRAATMVYRLQAGAHRQTGVVVECRVEDYRSGRIRKHEATSDMRVRLMTEHLAAAESELVPVTLVHLARSGLQSLLAEAASGEPYATLETADGLTETVWVVESPELVREVWRELHALDRLYIADGHHRMDAAERHARRRPSGTTPQPSDHVLCALFPSDEARVLGYHRGVGPVHGSPDRVLDALARHPLTLDLEPCTHADDARTARGVVAVYLRERWYRLRLRPPRDGTDPHAALDVVVLEDHILRTALAVDEAWAGATITAIPGNVDRAEVARWCEQHQAIGLMVQPATVDQIMAVADAGAVMPAKSTWFDPKARAGLFVRDLSSTVV